MAVNYNAIGAAIVSHLEGNMSSTTYMITQDIAQALSHTTQPVSVCVLFSGFSHQESHGQTDTTGTRDATYTIGLLARGESTDKQDELLDDAVSAIEYYCTAGSGLPVFSYTTIYLERSIATSAGPKTLTDDGLSTSLTIEVRIMEDE